MSAPIQGAIEPLLTVPGATADHLYREGSAKASFWEVLFGSRLAPEKRAKVSLMDDGTRVFDIPVASIEAEIFARARAWMAAQGDNSPAREALAALASHRLRLALVGLQPRGVAVASFNLRIEPTNDHSPTTLLPETFSRWFSEDRASLTAILVPFGFIPKEPVS